MRMRTRWGLATALVALAIFSNALLMLPVFSRADVQVPGRLPQNLDWQPFLVPEFGTRVDYPAGIFSMSDGKAETGLGERFHSADGRSMLTIYTRGNADGDTPANYLRKNLRMALTARDYERITPSFFAISAERDGLIFYSRCNFSSDVEDAIHCFDLVYPSAQERVWKAIVTRISRSLRPLEG
jgi:hypothetical protein